MSRLSSCLLVAVSSLTACGFLAPQPIDESDVRAAERRYDDAVATIYADAGKQRAAEARKVLKIYESALDAATRAGDLDRALAMRDKVKLYERLSGESSRRPERQVEFGGHSYALINEPVTWHVAKQRCEAMGGYLVCIETPEEDQFIAKLCQGNDVWLGGSDEEKEGEWRWVTGHPIEYKHPGFSPDNHMGVQHHLFYWSRGIWDDHCAGARYPFICEWGR